MATVYAMAILMKGYTRSEESLCCISSEAHGGEEDKHTDRQTEWGVERGRGGREIKLPNRLVLSPVSGLTYQAPDTLRFLTGLNSLAGIKVILSSV